MGKINQTTKRLALEDDPAARLSWLMDEIDEALDAWIECKHGFTLFESWQPYYKPRNAKVIETGMEILDMLGCAGKFGFTPANVAALINSGKHGKLKTKDFLDMVSAVFHINIRPGSPDLIRPVSTEEFRVVFTQWTNKNLRKGRSVSGALWSKDRIAWNLTLLCREIFQNDHYRLELLAGARKEFKAKYRYLPSK